MVQYFFHYYSGEACEIDDDGVDLPDAGSARNEGLAAARDTIIDLVLSGQSIEDQRFEIVDANGLLVDVIRFRVVLDNSPTHIS